LLWFTLFIVVYYFFVPAQHYYRHPIANFRIARLLCLHLYLDTPIALQYCSLCNILLQVKVHTLVANITPTLYIWCKKWL